MSEKWVGGEMRRNSFGFTMVEVMIVLLLLGIVSAVAVPALNNTLDEIKLDGAAREIVAAIQYAQSLAIKEGEVHGVHFEISPSNAFRCFKKVPGDIVLHPTDIKPFQIDFKAEGHLQGLDIISSTLPMHRVSFNNLGEASSAGTIVLGYAGIQKTINVTVPLGKVMVN